MKTEDVMEFILELPRIFLMYMLLQLNDNMRNEDVLLRANEQRTILHELSKRKATWIGHILSRNCLLQRVIEGKIKGGIEVTGRR